MSVQSIINGDNEMVISIEGRFDFSAHQDFRDSYEGNKDDVKSYVVDMNKASYLDSSALGMLLLLRDHANNHKADVRIANCNPDVHKILTISNFEQLFDIN